MVKLIIVGIMLALIDVSLIVLYSSLVIVSRKDEYLEDTSIYKNKLEVDKDV